MEAPAAAPAPVELTPAYAAPEPSVVAPSELAPSELAPSEVETVSADGFSAKVGSAIHARWANQRGSWLLMALVNERAAGTTPCVLPAVQPAARQHSASW